MGRSCRITIDQLREALPANEWVSSKHDNPIAPYLAHKVGVKMRHARRINDLLIELELAEMVELYIVEAGPHNSHSDTIITGVKRLV